MTMIVMPFAKPFRVELQGGLERMFLNTYDALDFLENEWPSRSGDAYGRALAACRESLEGTVSRKAVVTALIAACQEAGLKPLGLQASHASVRRAAA